MAVVRFADRVRRWGEGASTSGCWVCGEWVSREDTAVGLDIGMMGYALAHIPCANRLSLWLLEDVAHSGYSFTAGVRALHEVRHQPWCSNCGSTTNLTFDHLHPIGRGGTMADGVQVLCARCMGTVRLQAPSKKEGGPKSLEA